MLPTIGETSLQPRVLDDRSPQRSGRSSLYFAGIEAHKTTALGFRELRLNQLCLAHVLSRSRLWRGRWLEGQRKSSQGPGRRGGIGRAACQDIWPRGIEFSDNEPR